ncbi:MAG: hypothetical protein ACOX7I_03265 [Oscillospiraceae bacterium]|jgi:hypothetical protein
MQASSVPKAEEDSPVGLTMADGTYYDLEIGEGGCGSFVTDKEGNEYWRSIVDVQGQLIEAGTPASLTFKLGEELVEMPICQEY